MHVLMDAASLVEVGLVATQFASKTATVELLKPKVGLFDRREIWKSPFPHVLELNVRSKPAWV